MIVYVIAENPDDRVLSQASQALNDGRLICLPSDSSWVVLADPYSKIGVDRLYKFRHVDNSKHFTLFCADFTQAADVAHVGDAEFRLLKRLHNGGYTFIFKAQKVITKLLKASRTDHQVGVRFPTQPLMKRLLAHHGHPALGSHVDSTMFHEHPAGLPIWAGLIDDEMGTQFAMVLDPGEVEFLGSTTVLDLTEGAPLLVREGRGAWPV